MIGGSAPPLGLSVTSLHLWGACMLEKPLIAHKLVLIVARLRIVREVLKRPKILILKRY